MKTGQKLFIFKHRTENINDDNNSISGIHNQKKNQMKMET